MTGKARETREQSEPRPTPGENSPPGFRRRKLWLAIWIMAVGMGVAVAWHGWQGWGLGKHYPENTFLGNPVYNYDDYNNAKNIALLWIPYAVGIPDGYFPASYALFYRLFAWLEPIDGLLVFVNLSLLGILAAAIYALHPIAMETVAVLRARMSFSQVYLRSLAYALALLALSYPIWQAITRGNNEIFIALFTAVALLCLGRCRYALGLGWLLLGICLKLYPAALLVLFLRRGKLLWIPFALFTFFLINWASLASFPAPMSTILADEKQEMTMMYNLSILRNGGMGGTATPWNGIKLLVEWWSYHGDGSTESLLRNRLALVPVFEKCAVGFEVCCLLAAVAVTLYAFVEKEFLRRVVMLLLFIVMGSPYGGDYKMLHVITALVALLLISTRRPFDLWIVALLAFTLIPKREILLPFAGKTDTGFYDVYIGVILNPLSMLAAAGFLVWDTFRRWSPDWTVKRFRSVLSGFRWILRIGKARPASAP